MSVINDAIDAISNIAQNIGSFISNTFDNAIEAIGDIISSVGSTFRGSWDDNSSTPEKKVKVAIVSEAPIPNKVEIGYFGFDLSKPGVTTMIAPVDIVGTMIERGQVADGVSVKYATMTAGELDDLGFSSRGNELKYMDIFDGSITYELPKGYDGNARAINEFYTDLLENNTFGEIQEVLDSIYEEETPASDYVKAVSNLTGKSENYVKNNMGRDPDKVNTGKAKDEDYGQFVKGTNGADRFVFKDEAPVYVNGGAGSDRIAGTSVRDGDVLLGEGGNDTLIGNGGADIIDGGKGRDSIDGGFGHDTINGGNDNDTIKGGAGNDMVMGGNGNDYINGGAGNDFIDGGHGNDTLVGGAGKDIFNLHVRGHNGDKTLILDLDWNDTIRIGGEPGRISAPLNYKFVKAVQHGNGNTTLETVKHGGVRIIDDGSLGDYVFKDTREGVVNAALENGADLLIGL